MWATSGCSWTKTLCVCRSNSSDLSPLCIQTKKKKMQQVQTSTSDATLPLFAGTTKKALVCLRVDSLLVRQLYNHTPLSGNGHCGDCVVAQRAVGFPWVPLVPFQHCLVYLQGYLRPNNGLFSALGRRRLHCGSIQVQIVSSAFASFALLCRRLHLRIPPTLLSVSRKF